MEGDPASQLVSVRRSSTGRRVRTEVRHAWSDCAEASREREDGARCAARLTECGYFGEDGRRAPPLNSDGSPSRSPASCPLPPPRQASPGSNA